VSRNVNYRPWQALILAGGRSRRMGRDKASLPWHGQPLLDHLSAVLRDAGAQSVQVAGRQPDGCGIPDQWPEAGPLGGLASSLPMLVDGTLIVVPVDLPLLDGQLLMPLLDPGAAPACRYVDQPMPLCLQIDSRSRALIGALMDAAPGKRSMNLLFNRLAGLELVCAEGLQRQLLNCNTPADWQIALQTSSTRR
jgi:molybdopterin-guanine dinucleotide biosynthesis protein A